MKFRADARHGVNRRDPGTPTVLMISDAYRVERRRDPSPIHSHPLWLRKRLMRKVSFCFEPDELT